MTRGRWALAVALVAALGIGAVILPRATASIPSNLTDLKIQVYGSCGTKPCLRFTLGGNPASATTATPNTLTDLEIQSAVETATGEAAVRMGVVDVAGNSTPPLTVQNSQVTAVQNPANATENTLYTYSVPASLLARNGACLKAEMEAGFATNSNGKIIRAYFGSTSIQVASGAYSNVSGMFYLKVCRTGDLTQTAAGWGLINAQNPIVAIASPAETLTGAVTLKFTAQSEVAAPTLGEISATSFTINSVNQ